ncbi:MAG: alpha/beta hydrolase [Acidobacteriota bacterium]|nr:alpha/beta hydrolase [Acidobacteriota bacterium]
MPFADLPGVRLAYERLGPPPDAIDGENSDQEVVLVHGLGANLAFWYWGVGRPLGEHFPVTAYDLRGHGRSEVTQNGYTTAAMAADLLALLDHLGIAKAHLVGHSFGGAVALHAAVVAPERIASLTLVDAILRLFQPQPRLADCPDWQSLQQTYADLGVDLKGEDEIDYRLLEALADRSSRREPRKSREKTVYLPFESWNGSRRSAERWRKLLKSTELANEVKQISGLTREAVAALRLPMLAVYGELTYTMPSLDGLAAVQPGLDRVVVPGVGHFFPALAPQPLVDSVTTFLQDSTAPAKVHTAPAREQP